MKTIVLSNVPHYHYLATALDNAGCLDKYITSISLSEKGRAPFILPGYWKKKLEGRRISGIPSKKIFQLWLPEILQRGLPMTGLISTDRGNWINNHLFDRMSLRWIDYCDVFHFMSSVGLYCARKAKLLGATVICDVREVHPAFKRELMQAENESLSIPTVHQRELYREKMMEEFALADYLVVPSGYVRETFVRQGYDTRRISVLPYGADLSLFRKSPATNDCFRVLYVGRLTLEKGVHYLLQAFAQIKPIKAELLLIGTVDPNFKSILKRYEGSFTHIPAVPKKELASHYSNSSVLVLPSLTDSFGLVVPEAMACGLPVIVTENCGAKEVITDGKEGFIVPIRDVEALKEKILFLFENPDFRQQLGNAALDRAQEVTWDTYGKRARAFYSELDQKRHQPIEALASALSHA